MTKVKKPKPFSAKGYRDEEIICLSFDTETDGLGGELLFITACDLDKTHAYKGPRMIAEFFDLIEQYPYPAVWYAHHAQYDWRYFMEFIADSQIPCEISMRTETDIYQIKLFMESGQVVMRDSMAVFPESLSKFAKAFTPELPKLEIDIEHFDPENPEHVEYAKRDAQILRLGMPRFANMLFKAFGVTLGHTTAGTALKAWQYTLGEGISYESSMAGDNEEFIRSGYFGGLVFLTRTDNISGLDISAVTFDINSSYPNVMCKYGVPSGRMVKTTDYLSGLMGIYRANVTTPDDLIIPILPRRNQDGYMRWNRGTFDTTVTSSELIFAAQNGYTINHVYEGVAWEDVDYPFEKIISKCKRIRKEFKGQALEIWAKLIQNALYGKYGSRRERLKVFNPMEDEDTIGAMPIDAAGYFWLKKEFSEALRCIPQWAVFITAHARLDLIRQAYKVGVENVIYGDTDSLTVLPHVAHMFDSGDDYGQWKREKEWKQFRAIAPKVYSGERSTGEFMGAAKGLPKKQMQTHHWKSLSQGEKINVGYSSLPSLRVAMQKGVSPARQLSRCSTNINNSVNFELHGGCVRPKLAV